MLELFKMMLGIKTYWHPNTRTHVRNKLLEMLDSDISRYREAAEFLEDDQYAELVASATKVAESFKEYEDAFAQAGNTLIAQTSRPN